MTRVELRISGTVERYDSDGRLLEGSAVQPLTLAALSPEALADALAAITEQLTAAAWPAAPIAEVPHER